MIKRRLKPAASSPQEPDRNLDLPREPDYLLTDEAADLLRFKGPRKAQLFYKWAKRNRIPMLHRGRTLLFERRVLRASLHLRIVQAPRVGRKRTSVARNTVDGVAS